jgi:hypothetical protein
MKLYRLQNEGLSYFINDTDETVTVYNNNCVPLNVSQELEIQVGINYTILCNNI